MQKAFQEADNIDLLYQLEDTMRKELHVDRKFLPPLKFFFASIFLMSIILLISSYLGFWDTYSKVSYLHSLGYQNAANDSQVVFNFLHEKFPYWKGRENEVDLFLIKKFYESRTDDWSLIFSLFGILYLILIVLLIMVFVERRKRFKKIKTNLSEIRDIKNISDVNLIYALHFKHVMKRDHGWDFKNVDKLSDVESLVLEREKGTVFGELFFNKGQLMSLTVVILVALFTFVSPLKSFGIGVDGIKCFQQTDETKKFQMICYDNEGLSKYVTLEKKTTSDLMHFYLSLGSWNPVFLISFFLVFVSFFYFSSHPEKKQKKLFFKLIDR